MQSVDWNNLPVVLTLDDVAKILGRRRRYIQNKIKNGMLPGFRVKKAYRISRDALKQWLDSIK